MRAETGVSEFERSVGILFIAAVILELWDGDETDGMVAIKVAVDTYPGAGPPLESSNFELVVSALVEPPAKVEVKLVVPFMEGVPLE